MFCIQQNLVFLVILQDWFNRFWLVTKVINQWFLFFMTIYLILFSVCFRLLSNPINFRNVKLWSQKVDLGKKENLLKPCDFNTGFVSTQFIKELKRKGKVSLHEVLSYKRNTYEFVVSTVEKKCLVEFQSNQQLFVMLYSF